MLVTLRILAINPGSTSTKISVFANETEIWETNISHSKDELADFEHIYEEYEFREKIIKKELETAGFPLASFDAIVGRGGLVFPVAGGTYYVDKKLLSDLRKGVQGEHVSNLGAPIAHELAKFSNCPSFIVDPVVVDEMDPLARFSGHPLLKRRSIFHALNQKAVARKACADMGIKYEDARLIVVHLGGGISVGAHSLGKVIDVNNALNGDGPFTPERTGGLPSGDLSALCFSGEYTFAEVGKMIKGKGGIVAYLNTNDMRFVEDKVAEGDEAYILPYKAMAYQISKEIGGLSAVLKGKIDAIILTGGIAYDKTFVGWIKERVDFLADVLVYPGEKEMESLALGALRVLRREEEAKIYNP